VAERSIRALMIGGVLLMSLGFLLMSRAQALWELYAAFGLVMSAGMALAGPISNNTLLVNWFDRRRGLALGISQTGITISATALVPLTNWLIVAFDWRTTMLVFGTAPALILIPLLWFLVVRNPEEIGQRPDGDTPGRTPAPPEISTWTMGRALRDRRLWLLALVVGPSLAALSAVIQVLFTHITDQGMTRANAVVVIMVMTFMGAAAKPLFGALADLSSKRGVMAVAIGLQIAGLGLILAAESSPMLIAAGVLYGLGYGAVSPLWSMLIVALFGGSAFARIMGLMGPIMMPFSMLGFPFATYMFERTGSYQPAFAAFLGFLAISALALGFLRSSPHSPQHTPSTESTVRPSSGSKRPSGEAGS
jgi:MFS family permease